MCAHEIKVRGGFHRWKALFLRTWQGLVIWMDCIWEWLYWGYVRRWLWKIESDNKQTDSTELVGHEAPMDQSSLAILSTKHGGGVRPLAKKQITNILSAVTGGFSTFCFDQQFQNSSLVLQLQDLMTVNKSQCKKVPNETNGIAIDVPNWIACATQCKNRLKPMHEIQANGHRKN